MAADGSISISIDLDDKEAQKELDKIKKSIEKLEMDTKFKKATKTRLEEELKNIRESQKAINPDDDAAQKAIEKQYDSVASKIERLTESIKENEDAVGVLEEQYGSLAKTALIFAPVKLLTSAVKNIPNLLKSAFSAGAKAISTFGKGVLKAVSHLNVFSRAFDTIGPKIKRLSGLVKRVFVFSVITAGLRQLRSTISSFLEQNTELTLAADRAKAALTTAVMPIYNAAIPALTALLNTITQVMAAIARFNAALFDTTARQAQANAKALTEQANATKTAGSAAKSASKQLANFDEINKLSDSTTGSGGAEAAQGFDINFDDRQIDSWGQALSDVLDRLIEKVNRLPAIFSTAARKINGFSEKVLAALTFPGVQEKVARLGRDLADSLNALVAKIDWRSIGAALGAGLNMALSVLVGFAYSFDWVQLGGAIANNINGIVSQIDWRNFGRLLWAGFKISIEFLAGLLLNLDMGQLAEAASNIAIGFFDSITETLQKIDWSKIGEQVATFLKNIDWGGVARACFTAIGAGFGALASFLVGLFRDAIASIRKFFDEKTQEFVDMGGDITYAWLYGIGQAMIGIGKWIKKHIFDPFVEGFKSVFKIHSPSKVMEELGGFVVAGFLDGLKNGWKSVTKWLGNALEALTSKFKDGVSSLKSGISNIASKVTGDDVSVQSAQSALPNISRAQIPALAQGAVIPPNREFMAVLGDQRSGNNIEAPEELIRKIVREEAGGGYDEILRQILRAIQDGKVLAVDGLTFGRLVHQYGRAESARVGASLVNGGNV